MSEVNYIAESFKFMFFGMIIVGMFLIILVKLIELQAFLIKKFFPEEKILKSKSLNINTNKNKQVKVAIISAAISEFRKKQLTD